MRKLLFFLSLLPASVLGAGNPGITHPPIEIDYNNTVTYDYLYKLTITSGASFSNHGDGTATCQFVPGNLLLETGQSILLETGDHIVLEP